MITFADLAKALNRSTVYVSSLQSRFEIPTFDGAGYVLLIGGAEVRAKRMTFVSETIDIGKFVDAGYIRQYY